MAQDQNSMLYSMWTHLFVLLDQHRIRAGAYLGKMSDYQEIHSLMLSPATTRSSFDRLPINSNAEGILYLPRIP